MYQHFTHFFIEISSLRSIIEVLPHYGHMRYINLKPQNWKCEINERNVFSQIGCDILLEANKSEEIV